MSHGDRASEEAARTYRTDGNGAGAWHTCPVLPAGVDGAAAFTRLTLTSSVTQLVVSRVLRRGRSRGGRRAARRVRWARKARAGRWRC